MNSSCSASYFAAGKTVEANLFILSQRAYYCLFHFISQYSPKSWQLTEIWAGLPEFVTQHTPRIPVNYSLICLHYSRRYGCFGLGVHFIKALYCNCFTTISHSLLPNSLQLTVQSEALQICLMINVFIVWCRDTDLTNFVFRLSNDLVQTVFHTLRLCFA